MPNAMPETGIYVPPVRHTIASIIQFPTGDTGAANVIRQKLCGGCAMRKVCMPPDLNGAELRRFEDYVHTGAGSGQASICIIPGMPAIRFMLSARVSSGPRSFQTTVASR